MKYNNGVNKDSSQLSYETPQGQVNCVSIVAKPNNNMMKAPYLGFSLYW